MKGWDGVDVGYGSGEPKPRPMGDSRHHAMMGIAIQYAIEKMYNDELYRDPTRLSEVLISLAEREWERQEQDPRNALNFEKARLSREELVQICRDGVLGYITTMKAHRFLGPYAKAEVNLLGWVDKWNPLGGRPDVIVRRDDSGITILDGKNTTHKMKYTDPDQLRWYALLFRLAYKKMPDRLAYVWYRFPYSESESGVEWIDFTEDDLKGLAHRAVEAKKAMRKKKFGATPSPSTCRFCPWESECEDRATQKRSRSRTSKPIDPEMSKGFVDLTL